jgi:hypothetical protein
MGKCKMVYAKFDVQLCKRSHYLEPPQKHRLKEFSIASSRETEARQEAVFQGAQKPTIEKSDRLIAPRMAQRRASDKVVDKVVYGLLTTF